MSRATSHKNAVPGQLLVFVVPGDANSDRMTASLKKIPILHDVTTLINVLKKPYNGIDSVPTLVVDGRVKLTGTQAFEYLRGFDAELDDLPGGSCALGFSGIDETPNSKVEDGAWFSAY